VRAEASILHLDLDAFFAAVEQRDKPSLRGRPVIVGGVGNRGVVATASYEARAFGVHSAMPVGEARRRCPHAAFLAGRFPAYRAASRQVMAVLRGLSPLVEPLSLDEAFVDLAAAATPLDLSTSGLQLLVQGLKAEVAAATGGLSASVGVGSSKLIAKTATEIDKPDGCFIVEPGSEAALLRPMPVRVIPGVGPVTTERLRRLGVTTVHDLSQLPLRELVQVVGKAQGQALLDLAHARDERQVEPDREAKSISVEDTFESDLVNPRQLASVLQSHASQVALRLRTAQLLARTVTIKVRRHDFVTHTRARTLPTATDAVDVLASVAQSLLTAVDTSAGVRLLGVGVTGLTELVQESLFEPEGPAPVGNDAVATFPDGPRLLSRPARWMPGVDVEHDLHGRGWVWGAGAGRVTVRFETRDTPAGPVRTFRADDPALRVCIDEEESL
jgi:DNA polymerase-4